MSPGRKATTIGNYIGVFKDFFDFCQENQIISQEKGKLIFDDDYPQKNKSLVKDIPDYVFKQLKDKITALPEAISLIVEILIETGMRVSEVCILPLNCIEQDSDGDCWINCFRKKLKKENRLFISKKLAIKIQEHQEFIKVKFNTKFNNLFCTTEGYSWFENYCRTVKNGSKRRELNHFIPVGQPIHQATVRGYLYQLAHEHNITDVSGEIYPIWRCHQFRHTHLTNLARKGTGIAHIMQRAGHSSPQMAMQYIHLTDDDQKKKMKEVWDNTHFNMEGEIVAPVNPDLDTAEMQWIKKGMGMQTTDNGYCTLLWKQTCPHQDLPCKGCGSWVTTLDFLDSHKKELEETEKIIENARQKGYQRQIEKNVPRADRLKKIISGMEKHQTMRGLGHNEWEEKE
ncbi:MAG: tyrosine-type recombinase/integrase [Xenococcaceae cyanobacterium]